MNQYYYVDVSIKFEDKTRLHAISVELLKKNILQPLKQLFGESASNTIVDILHYNTAEQRAIIRVPINIYVKFRSSLTLATNYEQIPCRYHVNQAKPILLALLYDSRNFAF